MALPTFWFHTSNFQNFGRKCFCSYLATKFMKICCAALGNQYTGKRIDPPVHITIFNVLAPNNKASNKAVSQFSTSVTLSFQECYEHRYKQHAAFFMCLPAYHRGPPWTQGWAWLLPGEVAVSAGCSPTPMTPPPAHDSDFIWEQHNSPLEAHIFNTPSSDRSIPENNFICLSGAIGCSN